MASDSQSAVARQGSLIFALDTCGPSGSVALGRALGESVAILGQAELEGRSYSATLVSAANDLLAAQGVRLSQVDCIVVVNGPGSFTGVRVGLSAAKGLSEAAGVPLVAVSRLEVLSHAAGTDASGLDAHRHEVFLRLGGTESRELLAGAAELAAIAPPPAQIAVCDDHAAELLASVWPSSTLIRKGPPSAAEAIRLALPRIRAGRFDDVALLDGHYLRRSDAEIFGATVAAQASCS